MARSTLVMLNLVMMTAASAAFADDGEGSAESALPEDPVQALTVAGGLRSDDAAALAVETAPSVQRAHAMVLAARAGAQRARRALVPQIEFNGRYTRLSPVSNSGVSGSDDPDSLDALLELVEDPVVADILRGFTNFEFPVFLDRYTLEASITYPLSDAFLTILPAYRSARGGERVAEAQLQAERAGTMRRAKEAYYEYARAVASLSVAQKSVEQAEAHRREVAALVDAGAAALVDLRRVEAQSANARVGVARAQQGVAVSERALQTLIHRDEPIAIGDDFSDPPMPPTETLEVFERRALTQRPEVEALRHAVTAQNYQRRADRNGQLPELILQANVQYANPNSRIIPQREEFQATWDVTAAVRWSLNDMLDANGRKNESQANLMRAEADLMELEDGVRVEVATGFHGTHSARAALDAARVGLVAAEESYRARFVELEAGAVVTSDLIDAETDLTRARLEYIDATIGVHLAHTVLQHAVGTFTAPETP